MFFFFKLNALLVAPFKRTDSRLDLHAAVCRPALKIKNKENKISHGRGNSLRNKVRGCVDLDSPDPLKPLLSHPTE